MKVTVDKDKCIGCGACASIEPTVFNIGSGDNKAEVNPAGCTDDKKENCQEAANVCPVGAITIE